MAQVKANGINLEYEIGGPEDGEAMLLIMGTAGQLTLWPAGFYERLIEKGYRVIRYDHRDVGLSDKLAFLGEADIPGVIAAVSAGRKAHVGYSLDDLAADAVGLLDALGIERAHIVGGSMGGMVAQLVAANHPEHVLSLTSMMSTSANPELAPPAPEVMAHMTTPPPDPAVDREGFLDKMMSNEKLIGSPAYPSDEAVMRAQMSSNLDRCHYPSGFLRHYAAILAAPDRRPKLRSITAPSLVIHGEDDPLVPVEGGRDTAANIPNAELLVIPGMGHNLPEQLFDTLVDAIDRNARRGGGEAHVHGSASPLP